MSTIDYMPSTAIMVKAVEKSFEYPYGVKDVNSITPGRPAIVILGGDLTSLPRHATYYTKEIKSVLSDAELHDVDVYAFYYKFGSRSSYVERINMFKNAGHKINSLNVDQDVFEKRSEHMKQTEPRALYIKKIFDMVIRPIISTDENHIKQNAAMLRLYTHSHGGYIARELARIMKHELKTQNLSDNKIKDIQKQIIAIQHGPIAPLENPDFTTVTFGSASDTAMDMHNQFTEYVTNNSGDIFPCYLGGKNSHLFIVGQSKKNFDGEHDPRGLAAEDENVLTPDGKILFTAERNVIVNTMRAAANKHPTPHINKLVSGNGIDFDSLKQSGTFLYNRMLGDIRNQMQQNPIRGRQK